MTKDEALDLALEVMRNQGDVGVDEWIAAGAAIKQALAAPVQEPVAWQERQARRMSNGVVTEWTNWYPCRHRTIDEAREETSDHIPYEWRPLYTTPPATQHEPNGWAISYDGKTPYAIWPEGDGPLLDLEVKRQGGTCCKLPIYTTPPAQPAPTVQEPGQREFENWLRSKWTAGYACPKLEGRYTDKAAQSFWECWQAAHGITKDQP